MTITVHTTPACPQCITTKRSLDRRQAQYVTVDLATNETARAYVMNELGHKAAPVVVIQDEDGNVMDHWSGFRPDLLAKYAA